MNEFKPIYVAGSQICHCTAGVFVLLCLCTLFAASGVLADSETDRIWQELKIADSQIKASQVTWKKVTVYQPNPYADLPRAVAFAQERAQQQHLSVDETKVLVEKFRAETQQEVAGYTQQNTFVFLHQGATTRCDILNENGEYFSIDFYDGQNAVTLEGFLKGVGPGRRPTTGTLTRSAAQPLPHSASRAGALMFLVGSPITNDFSPTNSRMYKGRDGKIILEKHVEQQGIPIILRLSVSEGTLRPSMLEWINEFNNKPILRWRSMDYKEYPGKVQFQSKVTVECLSGAGPPAYIEEYTLKQAAFNQAADLTELRVPPGSQIGDMRFGKENSITYSLNATGQLPNDDRVRQMLKDEGHPANAASFSSHQTSSRMPKPQSLIILALSAFLIVSGTKLWIKPNDS